MKRASILFVLLPAALSADDVFLKGAGQITGRIVARSATSVEVDVGAGSVTVPLAQVERIQEGRCALDEYHERAQALAASDRAGWLALGRWASQQGLSKQAEEAYRRVLAIAPDDPDANQALGKVRLGDRWVSEEESYRARGYVELEGEWITPAEHAAILQAREAEQRKQAAEAEAREAEDRAREEAARAAEQEAQQRGPVWWGAWGPGPQAWVGPTFKVDPQAGRGPR